MAANIPTAEPGALDDAIVPDTPAVAPDSAGPQPVTGDAGYLQNVMDAYNQGYTYDDLVNHHDANDMAPPPRPSLDSVMSGKPLSMEDLQTPGRDAINSGAGPIGEAVIMGAAGGLVGLAKGLAEGALGAAVEDTGAAGQGAVTLADKVSKLSPFDINEPVAPPSGNFYQRLLENATPTSRAAQMGVTTSEDALQGRMTPLDLAVERGSTMVQTVAGNKWVRRGAGAVAAYNTLYPLKSKGSQ